MAISDQLQIIKELRHGPGETVEQRTDCVLKKRGWDAQLADIPDEEFRGLVRHALERLAVPGGRLDNPRDTEKERHKRETEKIAQSGVCGDLFMDQLVGLETDKLAGKLPREQYWVESLGSYVPRDQLASELHAVSELRRIVRAKLLEHDAIGDVYRYELAIFDELLRRGDVARRPGASEGVARPQ